MESERPQQVKVKTVAPVAPKGPALVFWEKHGNRILLGLTLLALLYALVSYRRSATRRAAEVAAENLGAARAAIAGFRSGDQLRKPPDQVAQDARTLEQSVDPALDAVITDADQPALRAQALVARGDLYWTLANLPELPGAATQPSLRPAKTPADYLAAAEAAYRQATESNADALATVAARLGLAAVAENAGRWDEAKALYDQVAADPASLPSTKLLAEVQSKQVDQLRLPMFTTTTRPTVNDPATRTSTTNPTAPASTQPATQPSTLPSAQ